MQSFEVKNKFLWKVFVVHITGEGKIFGFIVNEHVKLIFMESFV